MAVSIFDMDVQMTDLNRLADEYIDTVEEYCNDDGTVDGYVSYHMDACFKAGFRAALDCEEVRAMKQALDEVQMFGIDGSFFNCVAAASRGLAAFDKLKEQK
jgi:hypothetical protein